MKSAKLSNRFFYFLSIPLIVSFYFSFLSFFALLPFLLFYEKKPAFKLSFITFFPFLAFLYGGIFKSLYVYYGLNIFVAFFLYLLLVSYHFIYLYFPVYINKKLKFDIIFLPFLFTAFEYVKSTLFYGLPLGNLSLLAWNIPVFTKTASYFSSYFVTFELIFANIAVYFAMKKDMKFAPIAAFLAILTLFPYQKPISSFKKTITIVQGGIPQNQKWEDKYLNRNLNIYMKATKNLKSDVVFWPESAYPYVFEKNNNMLTGFAKHKRFALVAGVVREKSGKYFNSVVFMKGDRIKFYNKQILVPFAEFVPLRFLVGRFLPQSMDPGDFSRGKHNVIFQEGRLKIGPMICYEEAFSFISRKYKDSGANMLAVLTNDAWFSNTPTFYMLNRNAIFRAVENGIWLVRAANNGISEIVSPKGVVVDKLSPYRKGVLTKRLRITVTKRTFYDKGGYLFPVFIVIFVSLLIFYRKYRPRKPKA